jgi:hypothetical protein
MVEIADVYSLFKGNNTHVDTDFESSVYMDTDIYRRDILGSFTSHDLRRQLEVDFDRCEIFVEGHPCATVNDIPKAARAFCTQASLGLPLMLIAKDASLHFMDTIKDSHRKFTIDIWNDVICIYKSLGIFTLSGDHIEDLQRALTISVIVNLHTNVTLFRYSYFCTSAARECGVSDDELVHNKGPTT